MCVGAGGAKLYWNVIKGIFLTFECKGFCFRVGWDFISNSSAHSCTAYSNAPARVHHQYFALTFRICVSLCAAAATQSKKKHTQKGSATSVIIFTTSQIVRRSAIERIPSAFTKNSPSGAHRPPPHPRQGEEAQYIKLVAAAVTWRIIIARQILSHTHTHTRIR